MSEEQIGVLAILLLCWAGLTGWWYQLIRWSYPSEFKLGRFWPDRFYRRSSVAKDKLEAQ